MHSCLLHVGPPIGGLGPVTELYSGSRTEASNINKVLAFLPCVIHRRRARHFQPSQRYRPQRRLLRGERQTFVCEINQTYKKNNTETRKLGNCHQKLNEAISAYNKTRAIADKHRSPLTPPSHRKKKADSRILTPIGNRSIGTNTTMTNTEEEEQILDVVKSAGLTLEDIKKIAKIKDDDCNKNVALSLEEDKIEYSNKRREYLEKIREALQSKITNENEIFPFLFYFLSDNHDCMKSLLCLSEMNENVTPLPVSSRECMFKALKDTMMPDTLQKVRKFLLDYILGMVETYDKPTAEQQKFKGKEMRTDPRLVGCSMAKKVKLSAEMPNLMPLTNETVLKGVQSIMAPATITRSTELNLPVTNPIIWPNNNLRKRPEQSMVVGQMNMAATSITRSAHSNLLMTNTMIGPTNNVGKSVGQPVVANQMNMQKGLTMEPDGSDNKAEWLTLGLHNGTTYPNRVGASWNCLEVQLDYELFSLSDDEAGR
ncbi:hypothetical protein EVAR_38064_1 [Eumeta japonica]|uniref:Uncharacterized protein n=1 Tax=Eumeta variegata TaxID=151549 RepID=A0A4C1W8S0_EUMVA|nr:hypothetical protein EVAR_38064_1 [Eumeta japonica]